MIIVSEKILKAIRAEGEKYYPDECCGILYGRLSDENVKAVEEIEPVENGFEEGEKYHRFLITPEAMRKAELYARANGFDIAGFYHSHPDDKALPSKYDTDRAFPVYSYIIASVVNGKAAAVRSFQLSESKETQFSEEEIITL